MPESESGQAEGRSTAPPETVLRVCVSCSRALPESDYSRTQWKVGNRRRCLSCAQEEGDASHASVKTCWICLSSDDAHDFIQPCDCRGTTQYVHESCLLTWLSQSRREMNGRFTCPICKFQYRTNSAQLVADDKQRRANDHTLASVVSLFERLQFLDSDMAGDCRWRLTSSGFAATVHLCECFAFFVLLCCYWAEVVFGDDGFGPVSTHASGITRRWSDCFVATQHLMRLFTMVHICSLTAGWYEFVYDRLESLPWLPSTGRRHAVILLIINPSCPHVVRMILQTFLHAPIPDSVHSVLWAFLYRCFTSHVAVGLQCAFNCFCCSFWMKAAVQEWVFVREHVSTLWMLGVANGQVPPPGGQRNNHFNLGADADAVNNGLAGATAASSSQDSSPRLRVFSQRTATDQTMSD